MDRIRIGYLAILLCLPSTILAQTPEPWSTYRGNAQRTGNTDASPGPMQPRVLWVQKSKDNFIASPLPMGKDLIVSGLGAFNIGSMLSLSTAPKAGERIRWSKSTPFLKLPTVSSPAKLGQRIIFGDGMHQTDGATLYCLDVDQGIPIWRLNVPGKLVHLEGAPTIVAGKAYIGAGSAGVLCVEADKAEIDGKSLDLASIEKLMASRWKELHEKYEVERKKDEFAVPPNEDRLPKSEPKLVWQQGQEKWHVDAPVAVVAGKVFVASSFLDKEQTGDRALHCLDASSGKSIWRQPLKLNPWGGPSVQGDIVVISGSSISYDPKLFKGAKGFVAAFNLSDGSPRWSKDIVGGVLGCAALTADAAVVTSTDGKVRAFDLQTGDRQWIYEAKVPFFAPVAVAKDVVYASDLQGGIHAIDRKAGTELWKLDLGKAAEVQAPGMIYGGPIVQDGRLYLATCNLEGAHAGQPTVIICIGEK